MGQGDPTLNDPPLQSTGLGSKPRWITEIGFKANPAGQIDLPGQRERLRDAWSRFVDQRNARGFIVHRLLGGGPEADFGVIAEPAGDYSNIRRYRRPAFCGLAQIQGINARC
jgi:hypothetical protein